MASGLKRENDNFKKTDKKAFEAPDYENRSYCSVYQYLRRRIRFPANPSEGHIYGSDQNEFRQA